MSPGLVDDLRGRLAAGRVVVVAGSGVTAAATRGHELSSWSGLIASGLTCAAQLPGVQQGRLDAVRSLLDVGDSSALVSAAELVTEMLGGPEGGEYARWLQETVGSLALEDRSVPEALVALGVPVATTNYDDLIERASPGWERVTWLDGGGAMQRAMQGDEQAVVHLHGHWRAAHSVILGIRSYEELIKNGPTQSLQRAMATMNSLLFVGVGDGASDPNFGPLRRWLAATFPGSQYRHYRLCRNSEVEALSAEHAPQERIFPVGYGDRHEHLAGFLGDLAAAPRLRPRAAGAENATGAGAVVLPAKPVTLGRDDEIAEVLVRLLAVPAQPVLLHGAPGIGKTNLTLAALHSPELVGRFGERRWMVRCEATESATGLAAELATTLGTSAVGDVLAGVLAWLSASPGVVALDNLETPLECDTLAVEGLLGVIASVPGVVLIASLRGTERPGGVRWTQPTQLQPLDPISAKSLFMSIAPEQFDRPGLDDLLEEMGGIPLAVELLAHAADGEQSLESLGERWRAERTRLLTRGKADHRLLSIAVSVDTSWNSPGMTGPARRLLSILGRLPDGAAEGDLETLLPSEGPGAANLLRRRGLAYGQAGRLRTLPPVRHHLADAHPPPQTDWQRTISHYCQLSEQLGGLAGSPGGGEALARLSREAANVTVAVRQALEDEQPGQGYAAAGAFIDAARFSGIDAAPVVQALHAAAERSGDTQAVAYAKRRFADFAFARSDLDAARAAFAQALPLYRQVGDVLGEANCIRGLGGIALARSDHDAAREAFEQALPLHRQLGNVLGEANCIKGLGDIALERSDLDAAREASEQALPLYRQVGDVLGEANCIRGLGNIALAGSDLDAAREAFARALPLYRQVGDVLGEANCIKGLGNVAFECSELDAGREAFARALPLYRQVGNVLGEANCIQSLGDIALARSDLDAAREAFAQALSLYTRIEEPYSIGLANRRLAFLAEDPAVRCGHVAEARAALLRIKRHDLVAALAAEFDDCD
jgi:tetratricopeptide (TPR) repeat protein